jgi:hypothetical protein
MVPCDPPDVKPHDASVAAASGGAAKPPPTRFGTDIGTDSRTDSAITPDAAAADSRSTCGDHAGRGRADSRSAMWKSARSSRGAPAASASSMRCSSVCTAVRAIHSRPGSTVVSDGIV